MGKFLKFIVFVFGLYLSLSSFNSYAQSITVNANDPRHETQDQQSIEVLFSGIVSGTSAPGQWVVKINGTTVTTTGVTVGVPINTKATIGFDATSFNGVPYLLPGQTLTLQFTNTGNTLKVGGLTCANSPGFITSKNNWTGDCSDVAYLGQGTFGNPTNICVQVVADYIQFQFFVSLRVRNSSLWVPATSIYNVINWGDGSPSLGEPAQQSDVAGAASATYIDPTALPGSLPAVIMTTRPTYTYPNSTTPPGAPTQCGWVASITPALNLTSFTTCLGSTKTQLYPNYDTDANNTGSLSLLPSPTPTSNLVCLGTNVNMQFSDNTTLNCSLAAENRAPNQLKRHIRITYGSQNFGGPGNIPDIRVTLPAVLGGATIPVTNNNATGTLIFPSGYFPSSVGPADGNGVITLNAPVTASTLLTYMGTIKTVDPSLQAVGQRFYVKLEYWDICNAYRPLVPATLLLAESVENYVEIITKPPLAAPTPKSFCQNESMTTTPAGPAPPASCTTCFEVTAASVASNTEIKWYTTLADASADANPIVNDYGSQSRFLRPIETVSIASGGTGPIPSAGPAAGDTYSTWVRYRTGVAPNNCLSDPVRVTIIKRETLTTPTSVTSTSLFPICSGVSGVPFTASPPVGSNPLGGGWNYTWSTTGANITINPATNSENMTLDIAAIASGAKSVSALRKYTTLTTDGKDCASSNRTLNFSVDLRPVGGSITGGLSPICLGSSTGTGASVMTLTGATGTVVQWEVDNGSGFNAIPLTNGLLTYSEIPSPDDTYVYRVRVNNGTSCTAVVSATRTIIVREALPAPGAITSTSTFPLCASSTGVVFNSASPAPGSNPLGGAWNYTWGTTGGGLTINPSGPTTPSMTLDVSSATSGAKTVTIFSKYTTPDAYGSACPSPTTTVNFNVSRVTAVLSATPLSVCPSSSNNLSVNISGGVGPYEVKYSDGSTTTTVSNYISNTNISTGPLLTTTSYSIVSVKDFNNCFSVSNTGAPTVTVGSPPSAAVLSGAGSVCFGDPHNLFLTITGGVAPYTVNISPPAIAGLTITGYNSGDPIPVPTSAAGTLAYSVSVVTDNCGNSLAGPFGPVSVTVNNPPTATNQAPTVCSNPSGGLTATVDLTAQEAAINGSFGYTFSWFTTNTFGVLSGGPIATPTSYTVTNAVPVFCKVTDGGTGCTSFATVTYTVNPAPVLVTPQNKTICSGDAVNREIFLTPANTPVGTFFNWPDPDGVGGPASAGVNVLADPAGTLHITDILTNTTGAPITVTYVIAPTSSLGCPGTPRNVVITVNPAPVINAGQTKTICSGQLVNLEILQTPANTPAGTVFNWPDPDGAGPATAGSNVTADPLGKKHITNVLTNTSGAPITVTYVVTPKSSNGCFGAPQNIDIIVNPAPVITPGQIKTICSGSPVNLEVLQTPANLPAGTLYNWAIPTVSAGPAQGTAGANVAADPAGTLHITDVLTNTTGANITVTYNITPTSSALCVGTQVPVIITVKPEPKIVVGQTKTICSGQAVNYEILLSPLNAPVGTVFNWPDPDGGGPATGGTNIAMGAAGTKHILDVLTNFTAAPITVTFQVTPTSGAGCDGIQQDIFVTVNPLPVPNPISGNSTVCQGPNILLYQVTLNAGSTYAWSVPAPFVKFGGGTATDFFVLVKFPSAGVGSITMTETNSFGCTGGINSLPVTVSNAPGVITISGPASVCTNGTGITYSVVGPNPLSTYTWTAPGASFPGASSGVGLSTVTVDFGLVTPVTVQVTETSTSGCIGTPGSQAVTVNSRPVMTSANTSATCSGVAPTLNFTASIPRTFSWSVSSITGSLIGVLLTDTGVGNLSATYFGVSAIRNTSGAVGSVTFSVVPTTTANGCDGPAQSVTLTVNPEPVLVTPQTKTICSGKQVNYEILTTPANLPAGNIFNWSAPTMSDASSQGSPGLNVSAGAPGTLHITDILVNTTASPITATYLITPTSGAGCPGTSQTVVITVAPEPVMTSTNTETICSGTTPTLVFASTVASNYAWTITTITGTLTGASVGQTGSGDLSLQFTGPAVIKNTSASSAVVRFKVIPTSTTGSGCVGAPQFVDLTIAPEPLMTSAPTVTICSGQTPALTFTSTIAANYNWTVTSILGTVTGVVNGQVGTTDLSNTFFGAGAIKNVSGASGTVVFSVVPVSISGTCSGAPPQTVTMTVNPEPVMTSPNNNTICSGATPTLVFSANVPSNFAWTVTSITGTVSGVINGQTGSGDLSATFTGGSSIVNTSGAAASVTFSVIPTTSTGTGCTGASQSVTLNINPQPQMTSSNADAICSGSTPSLNFTSDVASNYNWIVTNILGTLSGVVVGQSGAGNLSVSFTGGAAIKNTTVSSGKVTFNVTPTSTTGTGCVGSPQVVTLTVNPEPVMTSPTNPLPFCSGSVPPLTFSSSVPSTFNWVVTSVTGTLSNVANGQFGTGNLSSTFTGLNAIINTSGALGTVTFSVTPTSTAGSCIGASQSVTISINPEPVMTSATSTTICSGQTPTLTFTSNIASTYGWQVSSIVGTVTGVSVLQTGSGDLSSTFSGGSAIKNTSTGIATVQFLVTPTSATGSGCVGAAQLVTLTVKPEPVMTSISNPSVCSGQSPTGFTFTSSITASYSWSVTNISGTLSGVSFLQSGTNDLSTTFTGGAVIRNISTSPGIVTFNVVPSAGGCLGAPQVVFLTVNPEPTGSDFTQPGCVNGTPLSHSIQSQISNVASLFTYAVTSTNNIAVPPGPNRIVASNALITDTYTNITGAAVTITYTITPFSSLGSCPGTPLLYKVNVSPLPVGSGTPGPADVCSKATISINPQTPYITNGVISTFIWSAIYDFGLTGGIGSGTANITDVLTNVTSGVLKATYTVTPSAGGCIGTPFTIVQNVNPEPVMTSSLSTPFTICSTNAVSSNQTGITLSVSNGVPAVTYNVVLKSKDSGLTGTPSTGTGLASNAIFSDKFGNITSAQLKVVYTVTPVATLSGCLGVPIDITVQVNPEPVLFNSGTPQVCSTNISNPPNPINVLLSTNGTSATAASYKLISPVSYSNGGPFSTTLPTGFTIVSATPVNASGNAQLIQSDKYKNTSSTSVTVRYTIQATSAASCISVPLDYDVVINPEPILAPGAVSICSGLAPGALINLFAAGGSVAISQYNLKQVLIQSGIAASGGNAGLGLYSTNTFLTTDVFTNTTSGPLQVTYTIAPITAAGCIGADQTVTLTINPSPALLDNLAKTVCSNQASGITFGTKGTSIAASNYNIINVTIQAGLVQTVGNVGARSGVAANEVTIDQFQNPTNGVLTVTYKVEPVSAAGCRGPQVDVVLSVEPAVTMVIPPPAAVCSDTPNTPSATNILLDSNTIPSSGSITFDYTAVSSPIGAVTGFFPAQSNLPKLFVIADKLVNGTNNVATVTYTITPKALGAKGGAGCQALAATTVVISVEPKPRLSITPATQVVCEGVATTMTLSTTTVPSAGTIQFTKVSAVPTGGMTLTSPPKLTYLNGEQIGDVWDNPTLLAQTVTYTFRSQVVGGLGCVSDDITVLLTVNPTPTIIASPQPPICSTDFVNITLTPDVSNTIATYTASVPAQITGASNGAGNLIFQTLFYNSLTPTVPNSDGPVIVNYTVTPKASNCTGPAIVVPVTVNPKPKILGVLSTYKVCHGNSLVIPLASNVIGTNYTWTVDNQSGLPGIVDQIVPGPLGINQIVTNTTGVQATLVYTIIPIGPNSCAGDQKTVIVTVAPEISASFQNLPSSICKGSSEFLIIQLNGQAPFSFVYNKNDGTTNTDIPVNGAGNFKVIQVTPLVTTTYTLKSVTDAFGCPFTVPPGQAVTITVGDTDPNFVVDGPTQFCSPFQFRFKYDQKAGTEYTWQWQDGSADSTYLATSNVTGQIVVHTFNNPSPNRNQDYTITLRVLLPAPFPGCFKFSSKKITVFPLIITNVSQDKTNICSGETVQFTNQSLGATSHRWFWRIPGSGQTNEIKTDPSFVNYTFTNTGALNPQPIEIIYQSNNGNCPAADFKLLVNVYKGATPNFTNKPVPNWNGSSTVQFTNTSTPSPLDFSQFEYKWSFGIPGDANPSNLIQIVDAEFPVTFATPGTKSISLTITNLANRSCVYALPPRDIFIDIDPLKAEFDVDPKELCFPGTIKVTKVDTGGGNLPLFYKWEVLSSGKTILTSGIRDIGEFTIGSPGKYTIRFQVSEPATGRVKTATPVDVIVYEKPLALFDLRPDIVFVPDTEMSTFNFTTGATGYDWDFGDGGKSDQFEPKYTYLIEGKYDVTLIAKNDHGNGVVCKDTLTRQIVAKQGGQAKIPNAFTPNTSGPSPDGRGANGSFNDVFLPLVKGVPNDSDAYNLQIYDRWGNLIFESTSSTRGWDGYNKDGKLMPAGVYVYKLTLRFSDSQRTTQVGDVTMIH